VPARTDTTGTPLSPCGQTLFERIRNRRVRAGIVGLGSVGLPLAIEFGRAGYTVLGFDVDAEKVALLGRGRSSSAAVADAAVAGLVRSGHLHTTTDFDLLRQLDSIHICVPAPLRRSTDPDVSFIMTAVETVASRMRPGALVVLESATFPGTTEQLLLPVLERSGLAVGRDFFLAVSPERSVPGDGRFSISNVPKVIGGITPDCTTLAAALYSASIPNVVPVSSTRGAEMVKLLENAFGAVNVALVNELALMCDRMQIDVWEVVNAAATKPFGFMPFHPGPGLGGHGAPADPLHLSWNGCPSGFDGRFIELAGAINGAMPQYIVSLIADALNDRRLPLNGSRVLIAGVAYRPEVDDVRESPALELLALLHARGALLSYTDPHVALLPGHLWENGIDLRHVDLSTAAAGSYHCAVVMTDHSGFDYHALQRAAAVVVDARNAIEAPGPNVVRLGAPRGVAKSLSEAAA
jgi:UDP-N-acetyl-D-glucosamine dehydrogenase